MNQTTKTILIAGGAVVGAFVLMKFLAPAPVVKTGSPSTTSSLSGLIGNIASIGGAVAGLFKGSGEPPVSGGYYDFGSKEQANIDAYNAQPGTQYGIAGIDYSF